MKFVCSLGVETFLMESALPGRIALSIIENVSRKMRDTSGETPALPLEEYAFSFYYPYPITNNSFLPFASIGVHSRFSLFFKRTFGDKGPCQEKPHLHILPHLKLKI